MIFYATILILFDTQGDLFIQDYGEPMRMWARTEDSLRTARWYSSWVLFTSLVPVCLMFGVWGTLSITNQLQQAEDDRPIEWFPLESEADLTIFDDEDTQPLNKAYTYIEMARFGLRARGDSGYTSGIEAAVSTLTSSSSGKSDKRVVGQEAAETLNADEESSPLLA